MFADSKQYVFGEAHIKYQLKNMSYPGAGKEIEGAHGLGHERDMEASGHLSLIHFRIASHTKQDFV